VLNSPQPFQTNSNLTFSNNPVNVNPLTGITKNVNLVTPPRTTPNKRPHPSPLPYSQGQLGKLANRLAREMGRTGWVSFFDHHQRPHSINPAIHSIPHPAAPYLHRLSRAGVPILLHTSPWSWKQRDLVIQRGAHTSASHQYASFLHSDLYEYIHMGYWTVLPYSSVRHLPSLRLAPAGVVPQRERRPRPIMDYSYYNVNQDCIPLHPQQSMQFGQTLQRLLQRLVYANPSHGPPLLSKLDLADGYYRVPLSPHAALALAVVIPSDTSKCNLVAIPLTLPMGWGQSPPYFCAFTETICDMANQSTLNHPTHSLVPLTQANHPLPEAIAYTKDAVVLGSSHAPPLHYCDVYIDDFITIAQHPLPLQTLNSLLHSIDAVFHDDSTTARRPVVSRSKIGKGEAVFSHEKAILGWHINTQSMTLALPKHRLDSLTTLLSATIQKARISVRNWKCLLGTLRSTTPALYGASHCFSILQYALTKTQGSRLRLTPLLKSVLTEWLLLARSAHQHPVSLHTLVPTKPTYIGATDASKAGIGGFWLPTAATNEPPCAWRASFPQSLQALLHTANNTSGTITNSALELAALVTGATTLSLTSPQSHPHILLATDNTPALSWLQKGSTTSNTAPAYLLHLLSRLRRASPHRTSLVFTPGVSNTLADCCSRSFHLSDDDFVAYLNHHFPLQTSWQLVRPPSNLLCSVNSALYKKLPLMASVPSEAEPVITCGIYGSPSATPWLPTHTSLLQTPYPSSNSLPIDIEMEPWLPASLKCALERWKTPFVPWDRRSPHWAAPTHDYNPPAN